jgi:hypothetical protein
MLPNSRLTAQLSRITEQTMFGDTGYLIKSVETGSFDAYNKPVYSESKIPLNCSFTDKPSRDIWKDHVDLEIIEGEVRFISQTPPTKGDKFQISGRFGSMNYPDRTYEIIGVANRDVFGFVIALKSVTV